MLKIKDNVDMKELGKFGFVAWSPMPEPKYTTYMLREKNLHIEIYGDEVYMEHNEYIFPRRIVIHSNSIKTYDLLYDLIKAGLVEKVEKIMDEEEVNKKICSC